MLPNKNKNNSGQTLVEILLAVGVAVLIIGASSQFVVVSRKSSEIAENRTTAAELAQEAAEAAQATARESWYNLWNTTKTTQEYYPAVIAGKWQLSTDSVSYKTIALGGKNYDRWIIIENVSRDASNNIESSYNAANDDPSTQKITITVSPPNNAPDIIWKLYLTRWQNEVGVQTDWSGGAGAAGPVTVFGTTYFSKSANLKTSTAGEISLTPQ